MLAREELLDQQRALGQRLRGGAQSQHQELVTQRIEARRLEADDRRAPFDVRRERSDHAARLAFRLVDEAGGEVGPAATKRPHSVGIVGKRPRDRDAIARPLQHGERGKRVLRLEVIGEGVNEQHDVNGLGALAVGALRGKERVAPPCRQRPLRGEP